MILKPAAHVVFSRSFLIFIFSLKPAAHNVCFPAGLLAF